MGALRAGSSHSLCAPKAVWFTGGWWLKAVWELLHSFPCFCGSYCVTAPFLEAHLSNRYPTSYPTLPLFTYLPNLIPPSDIFEVKILIHT